MMGMIGVMGVIDMICIIGMKDLIGVIGEMFGVVGVLLEDLVVVQLKVLIEWLQKQFVMLEWQMVIVVQCVKDDLVVVVEQQLLSVEVSVILVVFVMVIL